ncbi:hypothetical protein [Bdellovibrio bacteriovorus]|uniref:RxLR effector protein n=1 Tax=Bdellovibrio bacteriovorus TaxID=959 RepID=A0A150WC05_BDEBC|nr:hypothetical protein [Bdellovibrio bacteriovorus]KYG60441.1 hypothetical protein AZI85_13320 [Bdellovibrio bacteriovorus]KYG64235.1 hypothetical protein AZI87_13415 [Bdellovibrio bacteriovorus]
MKSVISLALVLLSLLTTEVSVAAGKDGKSVKPAAKKSQLGTSFRFNGSTLRGKYQSSMGTAATVENDKLLEDLLKGRTHFNDRQAKETERN